MSFELKDDFIDWVFSIHEQLQQCAQRNYYDGDYFCDIGLEDRMNASWKANNDAQELIKEGDVLAAHAEFGGDIESMQRAYEWYDLKSEVDRLKVQVSQYAYERDLARQERLCEGK